MDAKQFLAEFGHIASAPKGVKRLRELILSLAFRGSLCEHGIDNTSNLLSSLKEQRLNYSNVEARDRKRIIPTARALQPLHSIPEHWNWLALSEIGHGWGQKKPRTDFTYIDVSSINNKRGEIREPFTVLAANQAPSRARKIVRQGTIIYSTVRPYLLNIALIDREFEHEPIASTAFAVIHPWEGILPKYIYYYLHCPQFIAYTQSIQTGMAYPAISDAMFFSGAIPIPPTEEQKRIVTKIEELMALCDKLELQQQERELLNQFTYTAILDALSQAYTKDQLYKAWQRLKQSFELLFVYEASITNLEKTMLGLAVSARLAPQYQSDQHPSLLLQRLLEEKQRLIETGMIKKVRRGLPVTELVAPFKLPQGWEWCRLEDLFAIITDGDHQPPPRASAGVPFAVIGDLRGDHVNLDGGRFVPESYYENLDWSRKPVAGDILFTVTGSFGISLRVDTPNRFCVQRHVAIFKSLPSTPVSFLMILLRSQYAIDYAKSIATGIAQKTVPLSGLRNMPVPVPPEEEQERILQKSLEISRICSILQSQLALKMTTGSALAINSVGSITGIRIQEQEKMKAPKTELVSNLRIGVNPKNRDEAPLASILIRNNDELAAKALWSMSGLEIDAFYQQLKVEMAEGWIIQPEIPYIREVGRG